MPDAQQGWWRWLILSAAVIVLDLATKQWISAHFRFGEELRITSFFSLVLTYNTGAAFSFLSGASGWQRWFFIGLAAAAGVFLTWLLRRGGSVLYCAGLSLILGGALGNVWDRITLGKVVDFILVHWNRHDFPAFNVADSAITVGAVLLILDSFRQRHAEVAER
jgi:signal peptidase II